MTRRKKINILISIDDGYISHAKDLIFSIANNNDVFLDVYIIYNELLAEKTLKELADYLQEKKYGKLHPYFFNSKDYYFPIFINYISPVTYFRLYAPFIIKENIERLLYLDCDIICQGNILPFYDTDFEDKVIVCCENMYGEDWFEEKEINNERLGLPRGNIYINAGVILFDIEKYRKHVTAEMISNYIRDNSEILLFQDQDVINKLFFKKIKLQDKIYNYQVNTVTDGKEEDEVCIVHYSDFSKPWDPSYFSLRKAMYYYYFLKSKGETIKLYKLMVSHAMTYISNLYEYIMSNK